MDRATLQSLFDELIKIAEGTLRTELLPHQQRVVERMREAPGLVVAHGLGTGKTLSSIAVAADQPGTAVALVPASLRENYRKELEQHTEGVPVEIGSLQNVAVKGQAPAADLLIVDEAHRARQPGSKTYQALREAKAKKRLLLTASPVYNKPQDVAALVNLAAGDRVLPEGVEFEAKFVQRPPTDWRRFLPWSPREPSIKNKEELGQALRQWIDYHEQAGGEFPEKVEKTISVPMSSRQIALHNKAWGELPWTTRLKIEHGLPPEKEDLAGLNVFEAQTRQLSTTETPFSTEPTEITPKMRAAVQNLKNRIAENPEHKAVVYSNYLNPLKEYGSQLEQDKIPYALYTGAQPRSERDQIIRDYNAGKLKALLVSSAGGEGLDLKNTRQVQVLEPHWNEEKLRQVIGRAIRHRSHADLPPEQRVVDVEKYETYPTGFLGMKKPGVESWLYGLSADKDRLNREVLELMKEPR